MFFLDLFVFWLDDQDEAADEVAEVDEQDHRQCILYIQYIPLSLSLSLSLHYIYMLLFLLYSSKKEVPWFFKSGPWLLFDAAPFVIPLDLQDLEFRKELGSVDRNRFSACFTGGRAALGYHEVLGRGREFGSRSGLERRWRERAFSGFGVSSPLEGKYRDPNHQCSSNISIVGSGPLGLLS